jgi:hypothetical protein
MARQVAPVGRAGKGKRIDAAARSLNLGFAVKTHLSHALCVSIAVVGPLAVCCFADPRVIVSATAAPEYTQHKYGDGKTKPESYVVMQGHYFEGNTLDKSMDRIPFRRITEILAPELAQRQYWPAKNIKDADLLIVVHWGTTTPPVSMLELRAQTSPVPETPNTQAKMGIRAESPGFGASDFVSALLKEQQLTKEDVRLFFFAALEQGTDGLSNEASYARTLQVLGYTRFLRNPAMLSAEADSLASDLGQERYFIILKAYDLHASTPAARSRAVWTLHLNMSSPGNDFRTALDRMSVAAVDYIGRSTDRVETVRPPREGKVEIGPLVSHGVAE